jgi:hypothetical protein
MTMKQARPTVELKVDLSAIEARVIASLAKSDNLMDAALQLPRRHPLRFGLLYGMGPRKLYDYVKGLKLPSVTERKIGLEADIRCFENWQKNAGEEARDRLHAENEGIPEAVLPLKIPCEASAGPAWTPLRPYDGAVTGRRWAAPQFQFPARQWLLQASNHEDALRASLDRIKGWCRCAGKGYWFEQIDGPQNQRKVLCPNGCPDTSDYPEHGILRD